uniref:Potassium channel toxin Sp4 n=1 Tax=Scorpiops pococki TaxID=2766750 RepID=KA11N_SCOPC|nr:RecName: Full=Potassium channel toxin Sp4; Short=KTX-Sp4; Flags: Precursor [Scorpiops pococki]
MNKVHFALFLLVLTVLAVSGFPSENAPTGGCPLSDNVCSSYCKKNKFGNEGKCHGTICKCSIK